MSKLIPLNSMMLISPSIEFDFSPTRSIIKMKKSIFNNSVEEKSKLSTNHSICEVKCEVSEKINSIFNRIPLFKKHT